MNLRGDAISALTVAGFVGVDLDSPKYLDFVATHLSSKYGRGLSIDDPYVGEVVDYSRRPDVIDAAVDNVGKIGTEIGRQKYGRDIHFNVDPVKEDLKHTFGRGGS